VPQAKAADKQSEKIDKNILDIKKEPAPSQTASPPEQKEKMEYKQIGNFTVGKLLFLDQLFGYFQYYLLQLQY
jgi:hypothetical protein